MHSQLSNLTQLVTTQKKACLQLLPSRFRNSAYKPLRRKDIKQCGVPAKVMLLLRYELDEQNTRIDQQRAWWRERVRPVERAVALFVASLWPGVGEATVQARREAEERRRNEEEVERRRREEEEQRRIEGQEQKDMGQTEGSGEKSEKAEATGGQARSAGSVEGEKIAAGNGTASTS